MSRYAEVGVTTGIGEAGLVTTVVVADADPVARAGLAARLSTVEDVRVLAEVGNPREVMREVVLQRPDLLLIDLSDVDAVALVRQVRRAVPTIGVIGTYGHRETGLLPAIRAGVRGYLHKQAGLAALVRTVHAVVAGEAVFDARTAERLGELIGAAPARRPFPELTPREREVLDLIAAGMPNSAIARRLHLARKTVSNYLSVISGKLLVSDRAELRERAREVGLGASPVELMVS